MEQAASAGQGCLFRLSSNCFLLKKEDMWLEAKYEVQYQRNEILRVLTL